MATLSIRMRDDLKRKAQHQRVLAFMAETKAGTDPTSEKWQQVMGERF